VDATRVAWVDASEVEFPRWGSPPILPEIVDVRALEALMRTSLLTLVSGRALTPDILVWMRENVGPVDPQEFARRQRAMDNFLHQRQRRRRSPTPPGDVELATSGQAETRAEAVARAETRAGAEPAPPEVMRPAEESPAEGRVRFTPEEPSSSAAVAAVVQPPAVQPGWPALELPEAESLYEPPSTAESLYEPPGTLSEGYVSPAALDGLGSLGELLSSRPTSSGSSSSDGDLSLSPAAVCPSGPRTLYVTMNLPVHQGVSWRPSELG
jgi:hypothetical protein